MTEQQSQTNDNQYHKSIELTKKHLRFTIEGQTDTYFEMFKVLRKIKEAEKEHLLSGGGGPAVAEHVPASILQIENWYENIFLPALGEYEKELVNQFAEDEEDTEPLSQQKTAIKSILQSFWDNEDVTIYEFRDEVAQYRPPEVDEDIWNEQVTAFIAQLQTDQTSDEEPATDSSSDE